MDLNVLESYFYLKMGQCRGEVLRSQEKRDTVYALCVSELVTLKAPIEMIERMTTLYQKESK